MNKEYFMKEITKFSNVLETVYKDKLFHNTLFIRQSETDGKYICGVMMLQSMKNYNYRKDNYNKIQKTKEIIFVKECSYNQANKWLEDSRKLIYEHNYLIEHKWSI